MRTPRHACHTGVALGHQHGRLGGTDREIHRAPVPSPSRLGRSRPEPAPTGPRRMTDGLAGSDPTEDLPTVLGGRYRLERELGHGGMARVHLAFDLKHDRHVAIKVILRDLAAALGRSGSCARSASPHGFATPTSCHCSTPAMWTACSTSSCPTKRASRFGPGSTASGALAHRRMPSAILRDVARALDLCTRIRAWCTGTSSPTTCCSPAMPPW